MTESEEKPIVEIRAGFRMVVGPFYPQYDLILRHTSRRLGLIELMKVQKEMVAGKFNVLLAVTAAVGIFQVGSKTPLGRFDAVAAGAGAGRQPECPRFSRSRTSWKETCKLVLLTCVVWSHSSMMMKIVAFPPDDTF